MVPIIEDARHPLKYRMLVSCYYACTNDILSSEAVILVETPLLFDFIRCSGGNGGYYICGCSTTRSSTHCGIECFLFSQGKSKQYIVYTCVYLFLEWKWLVAYYSTSR